MKITWDFLKEQMENLVPSMSCDTENFDEWKKSARQKLTELLGIDKLVKCDPELEIDFEEEFDTFKEYRITFQSEKGYRVPCHLWLPKGVEKPPVIICMQGHSSGMHISMGRPKTDGDKQDVISGDRDFCVRDIKEGFATIALEQRNFGECGFTNCYEADMTSLVMGRTTIGARVWDVSRLIDVLEESFADILDLDNICCMGNSGGGTTTIYTAALEDRIVLAMPSCAMCTYKDSIVAMKHCSCNYVPGIANYFDMGDLMAMACPKYYVQVSGKTDPIFPLEGARKMFEAGKKGYETKGLSDKCALVEGEGGHRFYADDAWPIVHKFIGK